MPPKTNKAKPKTTKKQGKNVFDPQKIPNEAWNEILKYVAVADLKNLSLVCKAFYKLIGMLPNAMDRIVLSFNGYATSPISDKLLESSRVYRNIQLDRINLKRVAKILEKFGSNLRSLKIVECSYSKEELTSICEKILPNLRILEINGTKMKASGESTSTAKSFKFPRLNALRMMNSDPAVFNFLFDFLPDSLHEVAFGSDSKNSDAAQLSRLLVNQKGLKQLKLHLQSKDIEMIDWKNVGFQLEALEIKLLDSLKIKEDFQKFLKLQTKNLRELKLINFPLHDCGNVNMPNLKQLEIQTKDTQILGKGQKFVSPSCKSLTLKLSKDMPSPSFRSFLKKLPSIEEIEFKMKVESKIMKQVADNGSNLEKLTLHDFDDKSFKKVEFNNHLELVIQENQEDPSKKKTKEKLQDINMEHTASALENLEILKIRKKFPISSKSLLWMLENFKNLHHLEIENGSKLKNVSLCKMSHFFENFTFLKIANIDGSVEEFKEQLEEFPELICALTERSKDEEDYEDSDGSHDDNEDSSGSNHGSFNDFDPPPDTFGYNRRKYGEGSSKFNDNYDDADDDFY